MFFEHQNVQTHYIALHQIHKRMLFLSTSYDPFNFPFSQYTFSVRIKHFISCTKVQAQK